jgi:hypothetical protein
MYWEDGRRKLNKSGSKVNVELLSLPPLNEKTITYFKAMII